MPTGRKGGRPPKPIDIKEQQGNRGNRKLPDTVIGLEQEVVIPKLPLGYTAKDKDAKFIWDFIWKETGVLKTPDYFIAVLFLETWLDYVYYSKGFRDNSLEKTFLNPNGTIQNHPNWTQFKDVKVQLNTYMSSLGITPADRARIFVAMDADEEKSAMSKLLGERKVGEV